GRPVPVAGGGDRRSLGGNAGNRGAASEAPAAPGGLSYFLVRTRARTQNLLQGSPREPLSQGSHAPLELAKHRGVWIAAHQVPILSTIKLAVDCNDRVGRGGLGDSPRRAPVQVTRGL